MKALKIRLIFILICSAILSHSQSFYSRPAPDSGHLYGILDANDNWILAPKYKHIEDFHDYSFKNIKEYAIFEETKNVNGSEQIKTGLLNNKGEILVPSLYHYLYCDSGLCIASDENYSGKKIIDIRNNEIERSLYPVYKLKDSIIFYKINDEKYFKKIGSQKSFGPYRELEFDIKERVIYVEEINTKKLLHYDGSVFIEDPQMYNNYKGEFLFADDIYFKNIVVPNYEGKKITFANINSKTTFGEFVRVDVSNDRRSFLCCTSTSHGRGFEECHGSGFSIFEIEDYLKKGIVLEKDDKKYLKVNNKIALLNKEGKTISKFYEYKQNTHKNDFDLLETRNGIAEYIVLDENGKEVFRNLYSAIYYSDNFRLLHNKSTNEYFVNFGNRSVKIRNKDYEKISVVSKTYDSDIYELYGDGKYFYINKKGKIINQGTDNTTSKNFYHNRAFIRKNGIYSIIDDKFKIVKEIKASINFIQEIDQNGNAVCTTDMRNNVGFGFENLINVSTGKLLSDKKYERILRFSNNLYLAISDSKSNTDQSWWKYDLLDSKGNIVLQQNEEYESNSYGTKENYTYFRMGPDYYFYDNNGVFIGKNVLNRFDN